MSSIKLYCKMVTIFMNSANSKIYEPCRLWINFSDKINEKYFYLLDLNMYYARKYIKKLYK